VVEHRSSMLTAQDSIPSTQNKYECAHDTKAVAEGKQKQINFAP
jgi:hypothetical protein